MSSLPTSEPILYTRGGVVGEAEGTERRDGGGRGREAAAPPEPTTTRRAARDALPLPPDPYPGLRPFTHNESRLFCGRVMERLRLLKLLSESDFVAVLGSSGSGKSSLVLSGLLPDIRSGKLAGIPAAGMEFATFRPGRNPYANLAAALFKTSIGSGLPDSLVIEEHLRSSPLALANIFEVKNRWEEEAATLNKRLLEMRLRMLEAEKTDEDVSAAQLSSAGMLEENPPADAAAIERKADQQRLSSLKTELREQLSILTSSQTEGAAGESPSDMLALEKPNAATPAPPPSSLIIVVDQFEEIFRFANLVAKEQDEDSATRRDFRPVAGELDEAQAFITLLLAAARQSSARVRVVITMRSDFFKHCEVFEGLPEAIAAHQFITPRMSREQMEDAIQMPLDHFSSSISEDLVNELLNDVHGEFDQLPVLQHALARMWHQAKLLRPPQPAELTAEDYQHAARLQGAMNAHGDELITQNQLVKEQVGRFFRCLGDFDPTSGQAIRRPRTLAQISAESGLNAGAVCRIATIFAHPEASFITATPVLPAEDELWKLLDESRSIFEQPTPSLLAPEKPSEAIDLAWSRLSTEATTKLSAPDAAPPPSAGKELTKLLRADFGTSADQPQKTQVQTGTQPPPTVPKAIGDIIIDLTHECLLRKWQAYTDWMRSEKREGDALKTLKQRMDEFEWEITPTTKRDHLTLGQYQRFTEILPDIAHRPQSWGARYACDVAKTQRFLAAEKRYAFIRRWRWPLVGAAFLLIIAAGAVSRKQAAEANARTHEALAAEQKIRADAEAKAATEAKGRADAEAKFAAEQKIRADAEAKVAAMLEQINKIADGQSTAQNQAISMVGDLKTKLAEVQASKDEFGSLITTLIAEANVDHNKLPPNTQKKLDELGFLPGRKPASVESPPAYVSLYNSRKLEGFSKSLLSVALLPDPSEKDPYQYRLLTGGKGGLWSHLLHERSDVPPGAPAAPADIKLPAALRVWQQDAATLSVSTQPDSSGWITATNGGPDIGLSQDGGKSWITITTHSSGVSRARMLSGQRLVYGTINGRLGLIDVGQAELKDGPVFDSAHTGTINDIVASPDGTLLVASGDDNLATLWRIQDGLTLTPLDLGKYGKTGAPVHSASFSKDGRWLLLPSGDKSIQLCLLRTQGATTQVVKALTLTHDNFVNSGSFSPDGRWIATTDIAGKIYIWRSIPIPLTGADPQPVGIFAGHTSAISSLAWSPNSAGLATADQTGAVIVWSLQVGDTVSGVPLIMPTAAKKVDALAWSPDSSLLATADMAGTAQVHPLTFHMRTSYEILDGSKKSTDSLYVSAKDWPADLMAADFLLTAQASVTNPVNSTTTLVKVDADSSNAPGVGISASAATRLGLDGDEIEIAISKLIHQKQPANDQGTRMRIARFILNDQVAGDAIGGIEITPQVMEANDFGFRNGSEPVMLDWISTFVTEGMHAEAEAAAVDYYASATDIVNRWLDALAVNQGSAEAYDATGKLISGTSPSSPRYLASYNALQAYLRWMVSFYGTTGTARQIQTAFGDPPDGLMGPVTKNKLIKNLSDVRGLLGRLDKTDTSSMKMSEEVIARKKQQALTFAKSFLGPSSASVSEQQLIARARSAIGKSTRYELGKGGLDPTAPHPAADGKCDCSGFIAWVLGTSRLTSDPFYTKVTNLGGWMDVTSMQKDITTAGGMLSQVTEPYPGCIAAYGSGPDTARNVAIITEVTQRDGHTIPTKVINCAGDNWNQHRDAIQEIPADGFVNNPTTVYGRFDPPRPSSTTN